MTDYVLICPVCGDTQFHWEEGVNGDPILNCKSCGYDGSMDKKLIAKLSIDFGENCGTYAASCDDNSFITATNQTSTYVDCWYKCGGVAKVTVNAKSGYHLDHWELDGVNKGSDNPITNITMDKDHILVAVIVAD